MTARLAAVPARLREDSRSRASVAVVTAAVILAALSSVAASQSPLLLLGALVGAAVVGAVCLQPQMAAYLLLATTPVIVGMKRGFVVPGLRPSEVVLGVIAFACVLRAGGELARGTRVRLGVNRLDAAIVFFAVTGSIVPLLWLVARGKQVTQEDVLWGLQLWKYYAVFLIVRFSVRTERQVRTCLWVTMFAMSIVSLVAILQSLQLFGVPGLLAEFWGQDKDFASNERGTSTLASSLAVASLMVVSLAISATWLLRGARHKQTLLVFSVIFLLGVLAAGQFSGYIGFIVASVVVGYMTGSLGRYVAALVPALGVGGIALWPVIQERLSGFQSEAGLPHSWVGRLENLKTFFWPQLDHFNWVMGVRPAGRVPAPEKWREWVYIESGETWLLWTGGVLFFAAFWIFMWVAIQRVRAVARERVDAIGTAAVASLTSLVVICVLMTFDPHITLRGEAELAFSLLALALVGTTGGARARTRA